MIDPRERLKALLAERMRTIARMGHSHLRRVVGVQAPLVPGSNPPRAATRATPNAPPRRVSGVGQSGIRYEIDFENGIVRWISRIDYMAIHERSGRHEWLAKSIRAISPRLVNVLKTG